MVHCSALNMAIKGLNVLLLHWRHYSGYCTLPLELSWTSDHATMCLPPCENCTGCRSNRGSSSNCAVPARPQVTHRSFTSIHKWPANVCCWRTYLDDPPSERRAVAISSCHGQIGSSETEHSVSPLHECGIDCQPTSESDSCVRRRHPGAILRHFYLLLLTELR